MQIHNYKINSLLGEGGMAKVYLAYDKKFDTNVAVKLLNKEYTHNENIRKRFVAEAKSMFRMSHPNIIKVTDLIDEKDTVAFVMEYIEGETLKEYIDRKGRLTDNEIKSIFSQMLDAVGYVHEQNLVHRDIKPSNFMVTPGGKVKLMDFGIAKNTDATSMEYTQTGTGIQMGTLMYMSPEQVRSSKEVNHLTDIYSLGVVLWQMVVGQKPYDTHTLSNFDLQMKIVMEELPHTNTKWDEIIRKAICKEMSNRCPNCDFFNNLVSAVSPQTDNVSYESTVINIVHTHLFDEKLKQKNDYITNTKSNYCIGQEVDEGIIYHIDKENNELYLFRFMENELCNYFKCSNLNQDEWCVPQIYDLENIFKTKSNLSNSFKSVYWSCSEDYFRNGWAFSFEKGERIIMPKTDDCNVLLVKKVSC
jgi:serine/threonine protein kinase